VLILTRLEAVQYLAKVTVAPITSTVRGVASEVPLDVEDGMKQPCAANLHNVVTVAKSGLGRRVAKLSDEKMAAVCRAIAYTLGCEGS
jgi:mRNA interferase MazF